MDQSIAEARREREALQRGKQSPEVFPATPSTEGLSHRSRGWLKHLWHKTTAPHGPGTGDDWSFEGGGKPAEWWDAKSNAPMSSFPRFDLHESSYAMALMAERTPAWREAYVAIMDGLVSRYTTHWSAVDWLTQFGNDPDRSKYPPAWKGFIIPPEKWGHYDTPGWTGNGLRTPTIEPDPLSADAMLFFKGWLLLTMGIRAKIGGKEEWEKPWKMANVGGAFSEWTHSGAVQTLAEKFNSNDGDGLH